MATNWTGRWEGGRISTRRDGTEVYYLERMIEGGQRVSIAVGGKKDAPGELSLFERDPIAYLRQRAETVRAVRSAVVLDADAESRFLDFLKLKGCTLGYRLNVHTYLSQWTEHLDGRDLRTVTAAKLMEAVTEWGAAKRHRIIAIKSFCSWLREEQFTLTAAEDPTLALKVPPARPEKNIRRKGHTREEIERAYRTIDTQDVRDVLLLRAKTGMHEKEVGRIADGKCEIRDVRGQGRIAGTVRFVHKNGDEHIQSLDAQALAAAKRIAARVGWPPPRWKDRKSKHGGVDNKRQLRAFAAAAERLTAEARERDPNAKAVVPLRPGELRHSFVTWAGEVGVEIRPMDAGVPLANIAQAIGHRSTRTTRRFYDGTTIPPMIAIPLHLAHPDDPPIPSDESRRDPPAAARDAVSGSRSDAAPVAARKSRARSGRATPP